MFSGRRSGMRLTVCRVFEVLSPDVSQSIRIKPEIEHQVVEGPDGGLVVFLNHDASDLLTMYSCKRLGGSINQSPLSQGDDASEWPSSGLDIGRRTIPGTGKSMRLRSNSAGNC